MSDLPAIGDLGAQLPGVSALPGVNDLTNTAAGVTALASDPSGAIAYTADLAHGLDAQAIGQFERLTDPNSSLAAGTADHAFNTVDHLTDANDSLAAGTIDQGPKLVEHVTDSAFGSLGSADHVGDFTGVLNNVSDLNVKHVGGNVTHAVTGELSDVTHAAQNVVGGVVDNVTDTAGGASLSTVHDTVSTVAGDAGHDLLGNLHVGDVTHDLHLGL